MLHRGDVVPLPPPRGARGREQRGSRYAVVLQSPALARLSTVVLAPTSTHAQPAVFRPVATICGRRARVLVEQVKAIDRERLGDPVGHLKAHELDDVDEALTLVFGLF